MSGIDTVRGIGFQHAVTVDAVVDLLEDDSLARIEVESAEEIVDFQLVSKIGARVRIEQVKTRSSETSWYPSEIWELISRWQELADTEEAVFVFSTNGTLGPGASDVERLLSRYANGSHAESDELEVETHHIPRNSSVLRRVRIDSELGGTSSVLIQAERRIHRILESVKPTTTGEAEEMVNRLFRRIALVDNHGPHSTTLTRTEAAELIGLAEADVSTGSTWDIDLKLRYCQAIEALPNPDLIVALDAVGGGTPTQTDSAALDLVLTGSTATDILTTENLASNPQDLALVGPAGSGKSTMLRAVAIESARSQLLPILIDAKRVNGNLDRQIRVAVERTLNRGISLAAVSRIRREPDLVLLLDRAADLESVELEALTSTLSELRLFNPTVRVLVSGRSTGRAAAWGMPVYRVNGLTAQGRRSIASALLIENPDGVCRKIEDALGDAVENPLIFRLALSVDRLQEDPSTPAEAYQEFLKVLEVRSTIPTEAVYVVLGVVAWGLVGSAFPSMDRHAWFDHLSSAIVALNQQGLSSLPDAETISTAGQQIGLFVVEPWDDVKWLHDSFIEFLAAWTIQRGHMPLPENASPRWANSLDLLSQVAGMSDELARLVCSDQLLAQRMASRDNRDAASSSAAHIAELVQLLRAPLGDADPAQDARGLRLWLSGERVIAALHPDEQSRTVSDLAEVEFATAPIGLFVRGPGPPLELAVQLWRLLVDGFLADQFEGADLPIPTSRDELARAIESRFVEDRVALEELASRVCPTRVQDVVGQARLLGLRGIVGPEVDGPGGRMHPLWYETTGGDVHVEVGDQPANGEYRSWRIAESYLDSSSMNAAINHLKSVIEAQTS